HYFVKPGIAELPEILQSSVFDMYVNAGAAAVKILQRLLAKFGFPVVVDGVLGPKTATAAKMAFAVAPTYLADAYGIARRNYYYDLADKRMTSRKYARRKDGGKGGWITRAEEFISRRFHFSNVEHNQRVAAWG
ncbi:MAG: peptidoglycan-binding protein, partial [Rhodobacteraceae bacterium]|nr:peptidoglycan-binding protein [Paracoccaceae bacterium]